MPREMKMGPLRVIVWLCSLVSDMTVRNRHASKEELNDDQSCNCKPHAKLFPELKSRRLLDSWQLIEHPLRDFESLARKRRSSLSFQWVSRCGFHAT